MPVHPEIKRLDEANLLRVCEVCRDEEYDCLLLTADRPEALRKELRRDRRNDLRMKIHGLGLKFFELSGYFSGHSVNGHLTAVESLFVVYGLAGESALERLLKLCSYAFNVLDQEAVIGKDAGGMVRLSGSGKKQRLGEFTQENIADAFARLIRRKDTGLKFNFDACHTDDLDEVRKRHGHGARYLDPMIPTT